MFLNGVEVEEESFAEMFPTWLGRIVVAALNEKWAIGARIRAATEVSGIVSIKAANYGATSGPLRLYLRDVP